MKMNVDKSILYQSVRLCERDSTELRSERAMDELDYERGIRLMIVCSVGHREGGLEKGQVSHWSAGGHVEPLGI